MRVKQIYFNPRKKNLFLKSFCYSPSSKEEAHLGYLYILGQSNNKSLLKDLAGIIKEKYYSNADEPFNKAMEKANKILLNEHGDINIGVLAICDYSFLYSQVGQLKVFLLRDQEMLDIAKEPNRDRVFSDVINGDLNKRDIIIMQNQELFEQFWNSYLFKNIQKIKRIRELAKIFKDKKDIIKQFYGTSLFIYVKNPIIKIYFDYSKLTIPFIKLSKKIFPTSIVLQDKLKKGLISIVILIIILLLGWLIF